MGRPTLRIPPSDWLLEQARFSHLLTLANKGTRKLRSFNCCNYLINQFLSHRLAYILSLHIFVAESLWESDDELSRDWEAVSPTDEQMEDFGTDMPASTPKIGSPTEIKASSQLSAEAVAKSLLQKFAKTSHPAACELQWLVTYQDAPQSLLPLPQTVAVAPDDEPQVDTVKRNAVTRQNSLPVSDVGMNLVAVVGTILPQCCV